MPDSNLKDISLKLAPIEINSTLNNQNLINTLCGMFLMAGANMIYLTDEENDGQVYFEDNHLISVNWKDLKEEEALLKILSLDYAGVKIIKCQTPEEIHFKISLKVFLKLATPEKVNTMTDFNKGNDKLNTFNNLNFIKGFLALKDNIIVYHRNVIPDAVPIDYLRSLIGDGTGFNGIFCKVTQLQGIQAYYIMVQDGMTWIFQLRKNAERARLFPLLSANISKATKHV